jgi:hypothetical protein
LQPEIRLEKQDEKLMNHCRHCQIANEPLANLGGNLPPDALEPIAARWAKNTGELCNKKTKHRTYLSQQYHQHFATRNLAGETG